MQAYVEPFAGGAGVALSLLLDGTVNRIVINDYDKAIYSFWRAVRQEPTSLIDLIQNTPVTLVEIGLMTGRFHQIRCQMAYIGHPLYGDKKYGSKNTISKEEFPLYAYCISFPHPITKEVLTFSMEK